MPDNDLETQLAGLFADAAPEIEPESEAVEPDLLVEKTIFGLLEGEVETELPVAEPTVAGLPPMPVPAAVLEEGEATKVTEVERQEPRQPSQADFLAWETQLREQRTRILNIMLGSMAALGSVIVAFLLINLIREPSRWLQDYALYFGAYAALVALAMGRRIDPAVRATVLVLLAYGVGIAALLTEGPLSAGGLYLLIAPLLLSILVKQRAGAIGAVVSSLIYTGFLLADHLGWLHPTNPYRPEVLPSILSLSATFVLVSACMMFVQWMFNHTLTSALREAEQKHEESARSWVLLEERANELGKANALLQRRTLQLQTATQVSSVATSSVLDPDELVQQVVNLICDRFALYHVSLFLIPSPASGEEEREKWALLRADTGEAGRRTLRQDYKVRVDPSSTVGWCIINAQARIALDGGTAIPALPDTRSELALPLRSRGRVIGALALRSAERDAFSQEDIPVLQTMADQIAVAIDNAQLFAEAQANLKELEEVQRRYVREQWATFIATRTTPTYERTQPDVPPLGDAVPPEVERAMTQRKPVVQSDTGDGAEPAALVVPISLRDEIIGVLGLQEMKDGRRWTDDEIALIEAVADQMALAIENARLLDETRRRAERERLAADITTRVRASTNVDTILRTAIRELGRALRAADGLIQLGGDDNAGSLHADKGVRR